MLRRKRDAGRGKEEDEEEEEEGRDTQAVNKAVRILATMIYDRSTANSVAC